MSLYSSYILHQILLRSEEMTALLMGLCIIARAENGGANPDHGGTTADGVGKIIGHAHR